MKIAYLAGANSIHSVRWIQFFADRGHEIVWISLAPPISDAEALSRRVKFFLITPSPLRDLSGRMGDLYLLPSAVKVRSIIQKEKPDVLHVHSAGTYGLMATFSGFHPRVLTPWGSDILLNKGLRRLIVQKAIVTADAYTCDGENTIQTLLAYGAKREAIELIRFGTDTKKFSPKEKRMPAPDGTVRVISLRSMEPVYDHTTLLDAVSEVIKTRRIEVTMVGGGTIKEELEAYADTLGLRQRGAVKFVGRVENTKLPDLLRASDIYVSTSLSDSGLASSTGEAMASGLPVVVTDSGDNTEWVADASQGLEKAGGFVVPCKDSRMLAEKLIWLIDHPAEREAFGDNNRAVIEERYNFYREMEKVEELYKRVVGGKKQ